MHAEQILPLHPRTELEYWLAMLRAPKFGAVALQRMLEIFPTFTELFRTPWQELLNLGVAPALAAYLQNPAWRAVEQDLRWAEKPQQAILTWQDPNYPSLLKEAPGAPLVLFVHGDVEVLATPQIAIVGSRNPSPLGSESAFEFARHFASSGLTVTSGLALGVDAASHRGVLSVSGFTIGVMGTGLDRIYPARHRDLAEQIVAQGGALVSEFPPGVSAKAENFPRRNRIISGLSMGVLVVEAALQSGSLITARYALEQGREVFAIPGSIHNPLSKGCHALIKQGAKLVETARDVLEELGALFQLAKPTQSVMSLNLDLDLDRSALDNNQLKLVECMGYETASVDLLVERSGLSASMVSSILVGLELQGYITTVPGGYLRSAHFK